MTFDRLTRTFTISTSNVSHIGTYTINVYGYAPDSVVGIASFNVYIVAYNVACFSTSMGTVSAKSEYYRIGSGAKLFYVYPSLLSAASCYESTVYLAYMTGTQNLPLPSYVAFTPKLREFKIETTDTSLSG